MRKNVESIYPLSPMQEALLFHSLRMGPPDPGVVQLRGMLHGRLDTSAFERSWRQVVSRHPILRTSVHWHDLEKPLQVVHREVDVRVAFQNWSDLAPVEQNNRLEMFLDADQRSPLDLSQAPVTRLYAFRLSADVWHFAWTCHHVLLDGWSGALVLEEVLDLHESFCRDVEPALSNSRPFRDFVTWMQQQDTTSAESFWRQALEGVTAPTSLPFDQASGDGANEAASNIKQKVTLSRSETGSLQGFAKRHHLSLNTLVRGAWAALLSAHSGDDDVVFGATVSGRSMDLPGLDSMVGLFINTLPVRVTVARDDSVLSFLRQVQDRQAALHAYEYLPPAHIQGWSSVPEHQRLFESLIVFENYPVTTPDRQDRQLHIRNLRGGMTTNYPLTLVIVPGDEMTIHIIHDGRQFRAADMRTLLEEMTTTLKVMAAEPDRRLDDLMPPRPESEMPRTNLEGARRIDSEYSIDGRTGSRDQGADPARDPARNPARVAPYIAPRDHLEIQLTEIWEDLLKVRPIGVQDDFFALGGHSLLASRLVDRIERNLGKKLPLATLFQISTVEHLAAAVRNEGWSPPWSSLVAIKPGGRKRPIFCVHSWAGNVLFYRDLALHVDPDQPVYGLQAVGLNGETPPLESVDEMAEHYLGEIRSLQPNGPYALAGMCFGNAVALEMACRLMDRGEEVDTLIILDSGIRYVPEDGAKLGQHVRRVAERGIDRSLIRKAVRYAARRARRSRKLLHTVGRSSWQRLRTRFRGVALQASERLQIAQEKAWRSYMPRTFPGRITFVRSAGIAEQRKFDYQVPRWSDLAGEGLDIHVVPGDHETLLSEPHVRTLAARLQSCLDAPARVEASTTDEHASMLEQVG